jgi:hypothetical protein
MKIRAAVLSIGLVLLCACGASRASDPAPAPAHDPLVPRPWTKAFLSPAVLIADDIRIEGPDDLLQHFASQQDPSITTYTSRTTGAGLLQETVLQPGVGGVEITAQLDGWELRALRRLVVLQRFGDGPVTVRASGNAYWASASDGREKRAEVLTFRGERGE